MRSAALAELRAAGSPMFPVLRCEIVARNGKLLSMVASPQGRETTVGGVTHITMPGGWGPIDIGASLSDRRLNAVETAVSVMDREATLISLLESYDPRGSQAMIDLAAPGLAADDWEPLFRGVLADWARSGLSTVLFFKTNDTVLRSPIPTGVFTRTEWGAAAEPTIYGTHMPLVLGYHNSFSITSRGMIPCVNIRYDEENGYWWLISVDQIISVDKVYYDGVETQASWTLLQGVYGDNRCSIISITEATKPEKGVVVAVDCTGPNGNIVFEPNEIPLTGAPDQLKMLIDEYGYRRSPLSGWRGAQGICDETSWAAASQFFARLKIDSSRRLGGDQNIETLAELIDSFLESFPWVNIWWNELGKLQIGIVDPDDVDPADAAWLDIQKHHEGGELPFEPADRREVYTHLKMPFFWSAAEQKYLAAYEAHDIAALNEKVILTIENPWSQCRFDAGPINPESPLDPYPPSLSPSVSPSASPSASPSVSPSASFSASMSPSASPSVSPSGSPSASPSGSPSASESASYSPSASPSASVSPSTSPSASPSASPSQSPSASVSPSASISPSTSLSRSPSTSPSASPSVSPSASPSFPP